MAESRSGIRGTSSQVCTVARASGRSGEQTLNKQGVTTSVHRGRLPATETAREMALHHKRTRNPPAEKRPLVCGVGRHQAKRVGREGHRLMWKLCPQ